MLQRRLWSEAELQYLRENAPNKTLPELSAEMGISEPQLYAYLDRQGISYKHARRKWTKAEEFKLMGLVERHNADGAAEILGRPVPSVRQKMKQYNLRSYSGLYSMMQLAHETGYHHTQLEAARDALRQIWKRDGKRFFISECQKERLMLYFRDPKAALRMKDDEDIGLEEAA